MAFNQARKHVVANSPCGTMLPGTVDIDAHRREKGNFFFQPARIHGSRPMGTSQPLPEISPPQYDGYQRQLMKGRKKRLTTPPNRRITTLHQGPRRRDKDEWALVFDKKDRAASEHAIEVARRKAAKRRSLVDELDRQMAEREERARRIKERKRIELENIREGERLLRLEDERQRQKKHSRQERLRTELMNNEREKNNYVQQRLTTQRSEELELLKMEHEKAERDIRREHERKLREKERFKKLKESNQEMKRIKEQEKQREMDYEVQLMKEYVRREEAKEKRRAEEFQSRQRLVDGREEEGLKLVMEKRRIEKEQEERLHREMRARDERMARNDSIRKERARRLALNAMKDNSELIRMKRASREEYRLEQSKLRKELELQEKKLEEAHIRKQNRARQQRLQYGNELVSQMQNDVQRRGSNWEMSEYEKRVNGMRHFPN